eukprot:Gb_24496 [translate_table: standard]
MYRVLIDGKRYEVALQFAVQHRLDKDEVFKSQWLHSNHGKEAIQNFLSSIQDRSWVLLECLDKVGSSTDDVNAILSYGLVETGQYRFQETEKSGCSLFWQFCAIRLRLLQYKDRLETFLGINMGRYSSQEYATFRRAPLNEVGINLAESGKIGALNLLFKRHTYSLAPFMLNILGAVPETIPVHNYSQLLPGLTPPKIVVVGRDEDWVENQEMLIHIENCWQEQDKEIDLRMSTEHMVKLHRGLLWPSAMGVIEWYRERARTIDKTSGQLENCLSLVDFGHRKGIMELQHLLEDISDLCHVVFSGGEMADRDVDLSLTIWEQLCDYEKFKIMLNGVSEATVVERLRKLAVPFMHRKYGTKDLLDSVEQETFLVKWLKEIAEDNQLEICSVIIEEGCKDSQVNWLFKDEIQMIEVGLHCIYACTHTDRWALMASALSSLPRKGLRGKESFAGYEDFSPRQGFRRGSGRVLRNFPSSRPTDSKLTMSPIFLDEEDSSHSSCSRGHDVCATQEKEMEILENLEKRLRLAEGHVEAGRLLTHYQVARPIRFFLEAHKDEKGVKQLLRLLLSKFGRRQSGRSDSDWATMWRDMQCFQEKAFPFLDTEYMLLEFCRGLLKAGKFPLARNYLKGTASTSLAQDKAEILVIQAAREYFFSASSLDSSEIWKAKECLDLFPNSKQVKAEADVIDAITVKLPRLGVTLLPMQFRQMRDPMEIIKMAIMSQTGAYLKVEELIEVARLLGLTSSDDIAVVEAAIAREAGATGDLQLAVDLCLILARKDHGSVWDLCAALGRGPDLDKMDLQSRKELLGFALSHCDEESVGELLHAWKEFDLASQCENIGMTLGKKVPTLSDQEALVASFPIKNIEEIMDLIESSQMGQSLHGGQDEEEVFRILKNVLSNVTMKFSRNEVFDWGALLKENKRFMAFATLQLPWLLELNMTTSDDANRMADIRLPKFAKECCSANACAAAAILYWLACNNTPPRDNLILGLAKTAIEKPVTQEDDVLGCSYLLNLSDPHVGVEVIEEEIRTRKKYQEVHSAMKIGLIYSSLQGSVSEYETPKQRRDLLHKKFQEPQQTDADCVDDMEKIEITFWTEWRSRIAEQQKLADRARVLEQMIPGVETRRFLSGDTAYIHSIIISLVESVKMEKKSNLSKGLMLANDYGVDRSEVLVRYLSSLLVSEIWTNEEIASEMYENWNELLEHASDLLKVLSSTVYPAIDSSNKRRLAFLYKILSDCYMLIKEKRESECLFISGVGDTGLSSCLRDDLLNFLKTMIMAGCSFRAVFKITFQGRSMIISTTSIEYDNKMDHQTAERSTTSKHKYVDTLQDIQEAYANAIDFALREICSQASNDSEVEMDKLNSRSLHNVLSSLTGVVHEDEEVEALDPMGDEFILLQKVRREVWAKLSAFAEDLQLPNQVRVYALELLQCIAGRDCKQAFGTQDDTLLCWDGWDAFQSSGMETSGQESKKNVHRFTSILVALKSTELISAFWPGVEVCGEDLVTVDSAVSLFRALASNAISQSHISALGSLLKEWEGLFDTDNEISENTQTQYSEETTDAQDGWNEDVWDDGWETFQDPKVATEEKTKRVAAVHTLHTCWMILLEKLIEQCQLEEVLQLLAETCSNKNTALLTEDEAQKLTAMLAKIQPVLALKSALLLPYNSLWFQSLKIVEDKLKQTSIHGMKGEESNTTEILNDINQSDDGVDCGLIALILSVGHMPSLAGDPKFSTVFSYTCTLLGRLARLLQESHLCVLRKEDRDCISRMHDRGALLFSSVAFPYFIAELTRGKQYFLAGALVLQFMHAPTALNSINAVHVALKKYLEKESQAEHMKQQYPMDGLAFPCYLKFTMEGLKDKLGIVLKSAFCILSEDLK